MTDQSNDMQSTSPRPISVFWSAAPFVIMILALGIGSAVYHLNVPILLLVSAMITGVIAWAHGYTWHEMQEGIVEKLHVSLPAILILTSIGALIGAWFFAGTIPMMIFYGIKVIHPDWIVVSSFVIASIVSTVCGTSWGSVGSVGVALIGIAASLGAPLPLTAGAIVAGAYFGDKMSPLSESTNLAALVCGANLYEHIRHLFYTTMPIYAVSLVLYVALGHTASQSAYVQPAIIQATLDTLSTMYTFGWFSLVLVIPALVVIAGSIFKLPTIPTMLFSASIAFVIGITVQNFSYKDGIDSLVSGFNISMAQAKFPHVNAADITANIAPNVARLFKRGGGMEDMMKTLLVVFCAFGFAGIVSTTGMLDTLLKALTDRVALKRGPVILSTVMTCIVVGFTTGSSYLCLIIPSEMFRSAYKKAGLHPVNLSRTVEDAGTVLVPLIPWSMAGIFMYSQLGVPVIEYAPYAFLCYGCFILAVFYGFTGIGIRPLHAVQDDAKTPTETPKIHAGSALAGSPLTNSKSGS